MDDLKEKLLSIREINVTEQPRRDYLNDSSRQIAQKGCFSAVAPLPAPHLEESNDSLVKRHNPHQ
jgi:hypothetical protein